MYSNFCMSKASKGHPGVKKMKELNLVKEDSGDAKPAPTKEQLIAYEKKKKTLSDRLGTHEVGTTMYNDIETELSTLTAQFHAHFQ